MIISALQLGIYKWLDGATSWPVVWMEQNAPRPTQSYVAVRLGAGSVIAEDYIGAPNSSGDATMVGNREYMVEVQTYGPGARQMAETLRDSLTKETVQRGLRDNSSCVIDYGEVTNISSVLVNGYEERALFEPRIRTWAETGDQLGTIETVNGDATYFTADTTVAYAHNWSVSL